MQGVRRALLGLVVCGLALCASRGGAAAQDATFDVTLAGVRVAEMTVAGQETAGRYGVAVTIRSDGLAGVVKRIRFESRSEGRVARTGLVPEGYREKADTGRRQSQVDIVYDAGVPEVVTYTSPRPEDAERVDPATQGGALDPATALFAGLRDLPAGQGCAVAFRVFDGRRSAAYAASGTGPVCTATYRRVAGYSPEEMAERQIFPLELVYEAQGDVMRVVEASVQTIYGKVRLKRR